MSFRLGRLESPSRVLKSGIAILGLFALLASATVPLGAQQAVPSNLQAKVTGPTTVELSWTAAPKANGYVVQRAIGKHGLTRYTPDKIPGPSFRDSAAPAGSSLKYRVEATYADKA